MSKELRQGFVAVLAVVLVASLMSGCTLFKGKDKDDPFNDASQTRSSRPDAAASASKPGASSSTYASSYSSSTSSEPAETYVEPARPWGAETRDNLNN